MSCSPHRRVASHLVHQIPGSTPRTPRLPATARTDPRSHRCCRETIAPITVHIDRPHLPLRLPTASHRSPSYKSRRPPARRQCIWQPVCGRPPDEARTRRAGRCRLTGRRHLSPAARRSTRDPREPPTRPIICHTIPVLQLTRVPLLMWRVVAPPLAGRPPPC